MIQLRRGSLACIVRDQSGHFGLDGIHFRVLYNETRSYLLLVYQLCYKGQILNFLTVLQARLILLENKRMMSVS